jgi:uncharacterized protein
MPPSSQTPKGRAHLGTGWSFPIRPVAGGLRYVEGDLGVEQAIGIVLQTVKTERLLRPSFGAGLSSYVFANNTPATQRAVENEVRRALLEWEPRIQVERVRASASAEEPNLLLIEIDYRVRQSNAFYNRVFPFYLSEGA